MIDENTAARIKQSARIEDVFTAYGFELRRSGNEYKTICPFHHDHHPSMRVIPSRNICKCFPCGTPAMDAVGFVMRYENIGYPDALRRLASIVGIVVDDEPPIARPAPPRVSPPRATTQEPPTYTSPGIVESTMIYDSNPLMHYLAGLFGRDDAVAALRLYRVGTAHYKVNRAQGDADSVVFWQTDTDGNIRGGKIVPYGADGHRVKGDPHVKGDRDAAWAHTAQRIKDYNLRQCLFGLHLVKPGTKRVNVVESEKTAIMCALHFGDGTGVWCATGGKDGLRRVMDADALRDVELFLYPDADAIDEWESDTDELADAGLNVTMSRVMDDYVGTKSDLADLIESERAAAHQAAASDTATADTPDSTDTATPTASSSTATADATMPPMPQTWTADTAPAWPTAPGESEVEARANNASILNQALFVVDLLKNAYNFKPPTPEQIRILTEPAPAAAPF